MMEKIAKESCIWEAEMRRRSQTLVTGVHGATFKVLLLL